MKSVFLISILISSFAWGSGGAAAPTEHFKPLYPPKVPDHNKAFRLDTPVLTEPKALATVSGGATKLAWSAVKGADRYHVQVATDANFKWLVANEYLVNATSFEVSGLTPGQNYFWRVYGVKTDNESGWTNSFPSWSSFTVK